MIHHKGHEGHEGELKINREGYEYVTGLSPAKAPRRKGNGKQILWNG